MIKIESYLLGGRTFYAQSYSIDANNPLNDVMMTFESYSRFQESEIKTS